MRQKTEVLDVANLSKMNKSRNTVARLGLSIGLECVEFTCEVYAQILQAAEELEGIDTSELARFMGDLGPKGLLKPRTVWKFVTNPSKEITTTDLRRQKDWKKVSKRTVERYLKQFHNLQVLDKLTSKGQWGKRGSRPSGTHYRPPSRYKLNALFTGNLLINDAIDSDARKLFLLSQKLLLAMPGFRDSLSRIMTWIFRIVGDFQNIGAIVKEIPEFNLLLKGVSWEEALAQSRKADFLVFDEMVATSILKMKFPLDDEDLPWQESLRLAVIA